MLSIIGAIKNGFKLFLSIFDSIKNLNMRKRAKKEGAMEGQIEQNERDLKAYEHLRKSVSSRGYDFDSWVLEQSEKRKK